MIGIGDHNDFMSNLKWIVKYLCVRRVSFFYIKVYILKVHEFINDLYCCNKTDSYLLSISGPPVLKFKERRREYIL